MEIIIILLLTVLNGIFAMSEIALVSSKKNRLEQRALDGSRGAKAALKLLDAPEHFLSTVQVGITLIGIFAGAYGGVALAEDVAPFIARIDFLRPYADTVAFVVVVGLITYLSLIIGELVPKTIAMNNPEGITVRMAPIMSGLSRITYPIVAFLGLSTKLVLKLLRIRERTDPPVTEEELRYLIDQGSRHGVLAQAETDLLQNVFLFGDQRAINIMTPKKDIIWLDVNDSSEENVRLMYDSPPTKYPLCDGSLDRILGTIFTRDVVRAMQEKQEFSFRELARQPLYLPSRMPVLKILDQFRQQHTHIGYVINEYGSTIGVVTLHDLIENLLGDLPELGESAEQEIVRRQDGSWLLDGDVTILELEKALGVLLFPPQERPPFATVAGLLIHHLHKIPDEGDQITFEGFHFEVMDMDGVRVDKVLVKEVEAEEEDSPA